MNFQECLNKPETDINLKATVVQMDDRKANEKGKFARQVRLVDVNNMEQRVKIWEGSGMSLDPSQLNQVLSFKIRAYANQFGTFFSGFWEEREDAATPMNPAPQGPSQVPQNRTQAPNSPQGQQSSPPEGLSNKDASICRQVGGKVAGRCVAAMIQAGFMQTGTCVEAEIFQIAEPLAQWFLTGLRAAPDPSEIPDPDPSIQEDDPPLLR